MYFLISSLQRIVWCQCEVPLIRASNSADLGEDRLGFRGVVAGLSTPIRPFDYC